MQRLAERASEIALPRWIRRHRIDRPAQAIIRQSHVDDSIDIAPMNPGQELPAASQPATDEESEWRDHLLERPRARIKHNSKSQSDFAHAELSRANGFILPRQARCRKKGFPSRRFFGDLLIAIGWLVIIADRRGIDEK